MPNNKTKTAPYIFIVLFLVALFFGSQMLVSSAGPATAETAAAISAQFEALSAENITGDAFWNIVANIESKGQDALLDVRAGLQHKDTKIRIACSKIMYRMNQRLEAIDTLMALLETPLTEMDKPTFTAAAELLGNLISSDSNAADIEVSPIIAKVKSILDDTLDISRRLALAKLWYDLDKSSQAIKEIKEIANLKDMQIRFAAALTLASIGQFESSKDILKQVALDPTPTGRTAKLLLSYKELQDALIRRGSGRGGKTEADYAVLDEIIRLIKDKYVDPSLVDIDKFINAAATGICSTLDRFTYYEDETLKKRNAETITGKYGGIGAYVNTRDDYLTIERPMYGWPAYKAGLRSLDRVTEIEGESTKGKDLYYLIDKLKGDPGTPVKIKVYRRGWLKEREYSLVRAIISVKTARFEVLPGNIGYIQLTSFSAETANETRECLNELIKNGAVAVIIDLRNNPGGLLGVVSQICDFFLDKGQTVVTTRDKAGIVDEIKTVSSDTIAIPVYVLINSGSASASEILSGVLQDYKKAVLVGENTYGKGSVQRPFELAATNKKTALHLTIAKYYLPSGRSIHRGPDGKGGVDPDIKVTVPELDLGKASEFNKMLDSGELDKYLEQYYQQNKKLFEALADNDGEDSSRYPNFDEFYKNSKARLEKDEVRQALRDHVRRKVSDDRQKEFLFDLEQDIILQRAVIEICRLNSVNIDPEKIADFAKFAHKFDKPEKDVNKGEPVK